MELKEKTIKAMKGFLTDYEARLTGSGIAKAMKMNQKTVSTILGELEKDSILRSTMQGKNRLYSLNLDDEAGIVQFLSSVEHMSTMAFYNKHEMVKEIAVKALPFCEGIAAIFGSYAKGTQKHGSDIDLFIAGSAKTEEIGKISDIYKVDISIKLYSLADFKKALQKKDPLAVELIKAHIILKGTQEFVSCLRRFRYGKD